jgi:hypothetical protein
MDALKACDQRDRRSLLKVVGYRNFDVFSRRTRLFKPAAFLDCSRRWHFLLPQACDRMPYRATWQRS